MFSSNASQVSNDVKYIEDFCSVYLRTGTGSSQTVTTGVKENTGVLVISKSRSAATDWAWYDTFRGATKELASNTTAAEITQSQGLTSFNTDGHTWGTLAKVNTSGATYVDFVLKPTPKFFDVVTWSGDGTTRAIPHSLASSPGCIIIKNITSSSVWLVNHVGLSGGITGSRMFLNTTDAQFVGASNITAVSDTTFTVISTGANQSGQDYVAYLFAHDAGGFGLTGTDNVISCGSYTTNSSAEANITLGWEPQWVLVKPVNTSGDWRMFDNMRGAKASPGGAEFLYPNTSDVEATGSFSINATGFRDEGAIVANNTIIYIAIRRGPMKTPTTGTSVFAPVSATPSGATTVTTNFPVDLAINAQRDAGTSGNKVFWDRLRGSSTAAGQGLFSTLTNAEVSYSGNGIGLQSNTTIVDNYWNTLNGATTPVIYWNFRRAPGFFDVVCYTGTGTPQTITHNLGVAPELMIVKSRGNTRNWAVQSSYFGSPTQNYAILNLTNSLLGNVDIWNNTAPTATSFTVGSNTTSNESGFGMVAYLFASCPGVSKVGSYTGTGTTQTINCGFTAGSRFVLIKRTDSTGDWYVWDSARGIVAGNDPYLLLNSTAAEVTNTDYVDTYSAGFEISSTAPAAINASGGTFIYLAIA